MRLPCAHAYCAQIHFKIDIGDLSYPPNMGGVVFAKESYKLCYAGSCRLVLIDDLRPDGSTLPLLASNKPGRPRKICLKANSVPRRIRKQSWLASQSTADCCIKNNPHVDSMSRALSGARTHLHYQCPLEMERIKIIIPFTRTSSLRSLSYPIQSIIDIYISLGYWIITNNCKYHSIYGHCKQRI
jgi:hypothetical protein